MDTVAATTHPASAAVWRHGAASGAVAHLDTPCAACAPTAFVAGPPGRTAVTGPEAAADVLVPQLAVRDRERCVAAFLDTKHRLLGTTTVSIGSIDHTFMAPREVFRDALLANASALVLAHNHPSGDPEPSQDDELVTRRLARAGELLGVALLDHLVVGGADWVSLARRGVI
ncbi:DNA repair protein RadC [Egicoccus sp. AB-alg6-2]|uniref:RadC family protein n=1 Tax=Egicoccus sp. AB-alg6-2 TaxID=3242692 RepID=UPI00359EB949